MNFAQPDNSGAAALQGTDAHSAAGSWGPVTLQFDISVTYAVLLQIL